MRHYVCKLISIACAVPFSLSVYAEEVCTTGTASLGCVTERAFDELRALKDDDEAFRKAAAAFAVSGVCVVFEAGESVFVEDRTIFSQMRQIRRKGQLQKYWTTASATTDKPCPSAQASAPPDRPPPLSPTNPVKYPTGRTPVAPIHAGREERAKPTCEFKPTMTDAEIAACR